ncbi:MAG: D-alanine--D-alanine ligase [Deltaproteobacteria bacterium]|nr:D-alanine--D-alanine ligase [Deltaproteobacteria bacterium]
MSAQPLPTPLPLSTRVVVLYGGLSSEREVSLKSGRAVHAALAARGYDARLLDPRDPLSDPRGPGRAIDLVAALRGLGAEVVFNALHGTYGEDGCLQGLLEWARLPYTGSGVKASALAMDKELTRVLMARAGVPVAQARVWRAGDPLPAAEALPPGPWALKPLAEGSSVGVSRRESLASLHEGLAGARGAWLIESWLAGTELSVMVLDGEAWGAVEIAPASGWYDYEAKYLRDDTQYHCPPRVSASVDARVRDLAARAYAALECRGAARVDFIVRDPQGGADAPLIALEVNTSPGMTATSLVPKIAAQRGLSFEDLVTRLLAGARLDVEGGA